jgi:hypothetical protein
MKKSEIENILADPPSIIHKVLALSWYQNDTREYDGLSKHRQNQIELALAEINKLTPTTFDGKLVKPGDVVFILDSLYNIEETEVQPVEPFTDYELFGTKIPVKNTFSSKRAAARYKKHLSIKQGN